MPTFDGDNLIITLDAPTAGILTMGAEVDLYNAWKDWMLESPVNRKYPPAFRTTGGDPLTPGIDAGAYFFVRNDYGWRARPDESDHTVYLNGNLPPEDSSLPIMIPTIGGYTVLVDGLQPITQNVDTIINEQNQNVVQLVERIENLRPHHTGTGDSYYWDPYGGDNTNEGTTRETACKTFQYIHDNLVTDNGHDTVNCVPGNPSGVTIADEILSISKNYVFVRGPGRDFKILTTSTGSDTITITGNGVELSGIIVSNTAGNQDALVHTSGDFTLLNNTWLEDAAGIGLKITDGHHHLIKDTKIHDSVLNGIDAQGTGIDELKFEDVMSDDNGLNGIFIDNTATQAEIYITNKCTFNGNTGYGVRFGSTSYNVRLDADTAIYGNTAGSVLDLGTDNYIELDEKVAAPILQLHHSVESLRDNYAAYGDFYYWDPYGGDDNQSGNTPEKAVKTFAAAHALVQDYHFDVIFPLATDPSGVTTVTEVITVTKNNLYIRGPGRGFLIKPTSTVDDSVTVTADNVEFSSMEISTAATGTNIGLCVNGGDNFLAKNIWTNNTTGDGIKILNSAFSQILGGYILFAGGHGFNVGSSVNHLWIDSPIIHGSTDDGVHVEGTSIVEPKLIGRVDIHLSGGYGLNIVTGSIYKPLLSDKAAFYGNTLGDINDPNDLLAYEADLDHANLLKTNMVEDYPVDGQSAATPTQMLYSINQMLSEFARTGTTVSIKKRGGTEAFELTLDDDAAPTQSTQSS
jgi:hypothetical protein